MSFTPDYDRRADAEIYLGSEWGCANRFIDEWGGIARFCPDVGRAGEWMVWGLEPGVWSVDRSGALVQGLAQETCARQELAHDNAGAYLRSAMIRNVLSAARPGLIVGLDQFDADPLLLCCADGVLSLRREDCGRLLEHSAELLMTKSTGVALRKYCDAKGIVHLPDDWGWETSEWENHLRYMTQNLEDEKGIEFRDFFARWSGTALLGSQDLKPHKFLNLRGKGRNGKGVAAEARVTAMGDYGMIGPIRLVTRRQSDHSTELAGCEGRRLLVVEEVSMVQAAVVKDLTGGGRITARRMRQDDASFPKSWALEMNSNPPLNLQGEGSKAMRLRKIVANLGDEIPETKHRDGVLDLLKEESGLILVWMLDGLRRWYEDGGRTVGLKIPGWMSEHGEQESDDDDVIDALLAERFEKDPDGKVLGSTFVEMTNDRRKKAGFLPLTPAAIFAYLRDADYEVKKSTANKTYIFGLKLSTNVPINELAPPDLSAASQN